MASPLDEKRGDARMQENLTPEQAARAYARAWDSLGPEEFITLLDDNVRYESQWVFSCLRGREAVAEYLRGKISSVRRTGSVVRAIFGVTRTSMPDRPCVIMYQDTHGSEPSAVVIFSTAGGKITDVDMCICDLFDPVAV